MKLMTALGSEFDTASARRTFVHRWRRHHGRSCGNCCNRRNEAVTSRKKNNCIDELSSASAPAWCAEELNNQEKHANWNVQREEPAEDIGCHLLQAFKLRTLPPCCVWRFEASTCHHMGVGRVQKARRKRSTLHQEPHPARRRHVRSRHHNP